MARTNSLDAYFGSVTTKPAVKVEVKAQTPTEPRPMQETAVVKPKKRGQRQPYPPVCPENLPPSYFVSASYDGRQKKAVIKLYEPESGQIYFWYDNTGHKPYCLTNLTPYELNKIESLTHHEGFDSLEVTERYDPLQNQTSKSQK